MPPRKNDAATADFRRRRFGMFIHWGVYSALAGSWRGRTVGDDLGEWIMNCLRIPVREYEQVAAAFNPAAFDAEALVETARRAGMGYIVITAKHHDGFAMFRSRCDPYNICDWTGCGRDVIAELAAACRRHGLKLGFYYSQSLDWHEEHAGGWERTRVKPTRHTWGNVWDFPDNAKKDFRLYFERKVKPQVSQLLTDYGDVFLMWFDTPLTITPAQSEELYRLVKQHQPDCLVNSRIGNGRGDYFSLGDNQVPALALEKPYEAPVTLNDTWGYKEDDHNWKSGREIIELLVKLASRNVNLLLNVGPRGDGSLTPETGAVLAEVAAWMKTGAPAVQGTAGSPLAGDLDWGWLTVGADRCFLSLRDPGPRELVLAGLKNRVTGVHRLADRRAVPFRQVREPAAALYQLALDLPPDESFLPVYAVACAGKPSFQPGNRLQNRTLWLAAADADLYDRRWKKARAVHVENRYLDYDRYGKLKIDTGGVLDGWSLAGEKLRWEAFFSCPGEYRVELITAASPGDFGDGTAAGNATAAGAAVVIDVAGAGGLRATLRPDFQYAESRTSRGNRRLGTACGRLLVPGTGWRRVTLALAADRPDPAAGVPLVALRFVKNTGVNS